MHTKAGPAVEVKITNEDKGEVQAVFSTLNVKDKDGDVTEPGAFGEQNVRISAYNHQSWQGELPIGKGTINEQGDSAVLNGQFFLNTSKGKDTFHVIKELGDLMEWSYGFDILERSDGTWPKDASDGEEVQYLKKLKVHEVSPVILGAGVDTRTLSAKGTKGVIPYKSTGTTDAAWDGPANTARVTASAAALRSLCAWVDSSSDADSKGSYKFPHHMVSGDGSVGVANTRACTAAIAVLNGGRGGASIPDSDRSGVYNHVAHHIRDAGGDPPPLKSREEVLLNGLSLFDDVAITATEFDTVVTRIADVVAMRKENGKSLSDPVNDMVEQMLASSDRLREVLTNVPSNRSTNPKEKELAQAIFRDARSLLHLTGGYDGR